MLVSAFINGEIPRDNLLICPREVPAEAERSYAVLRFRQVDARGARFKSHAVRTGLALGIDALGIYGRGSACRPYDIIRKENCHAVAVFLIYQRRAKRDDAAGSAAAAKYFHGAVAVENRDVFAFHGALKRLGHIF